MDPSTPVVNNSLNGEQNYHGTIVMLNDNCLMKIFSFMDLMDLQTLASVCCRFKSICEDIYTKYKSLDLNLFRDISIRDTHLMLHNVAPFLQSMKMPCNLQDYQWLILVAKYCKNLNSFSLEGFRHWRNHNLTPFYEIFGNLQRIELINCGLLDKYLYDMLHVSREFPEASVLEELNLSANCGLTGAALKNIVGLKAIDLSFCNNLQPYYFLQIVANNKNLRKLNIIDCSLLDKKCIEAIASHLKELEEIHVSDHIELDPLYQLKELRTLTLG